MILSIDTTQPIASLKLFDKTAGLVDENKFDNGFNLSESILVRVEELLKKNQLSTGDLAAIVVHRGPGSYTSVRIGVTAANFLAFGLGIPVYGAEKEIDSELIKNTLQEKEINANFVLPKYLFPPHITQKSRRA